MQGRPSTASSPERSSFEIALRTGRCHVGFGHRCPGIPQHPEILGLRGAELPNFGANLVHAGQRWPTSVEVGANLADVGTKLADFGPKLADGAPILTDAGHVWPSWDGIGAIFGRCRPESGANISPTLVHSGHTSPESGHTRPSLFEIDLGIRPAPAYVRSETPSESLSQMGAVISECHGAAMPLPRKRHVAAMSAY